MRKGIPMPTIISNCQTHLITSNSKTNIITSNSKKHIITTNSQTNIKTTNSQTHPIISNAKKTPIVLSFRQFCNRRRLKVLKFQMIKITKTFLTFLNLLFELKKLFFELSNWDISETNSFYLDLKRFN